jgi:hypothetical protein
MNPLFQGAFTCFSAHLTEMKAAVKARPKEPGFSGFVAAMFTWKTGRVEMWMG